uniref:Secreted protein n=1 Tax=Plectus sambesii TaxID=2011161 RepID=A0A914VH15_9BILA
MVMSPPVAPSAKVMVTAKVMMAAAVVMTREVVVAPAKMPMSTMPMGIGTIQDVGVGSPKKESNVLLSGHQLGGQRTHANKLVSNQQFYEV